MPRDSRSSFGRCFAPVSMHDWVGVPSSSRVGERNPEHESDRKFRRFVDRRRLVEGADASLEIDRKRAQAEEIASEEAVEWAADEARELLGIEAERARRELVILSGPAGRLRVGEAHR